MSVTVLGQTASASGQLLAQGVVQSVPPALSPPTGPATAEVVSQRAAAARGRAQGEPLMVASARATTGGLRLRFSAPLDLTPLAKLARNGEVRTADVLVSRGGQAVAGYLVIDPDGQGFVFRPDAASLSDGVYEMVLRTGNGTFVSRGGQPLDGDHDGVPGGDFRVRFIVKREALADGSLLMAQYRGIGRTGAVDPKPAEDGSTILANTGAAAMLMASLGPWNQRARRSAEPVRARRRPLSEAGPAPVVRFEAAASSLSDIASAPAPQWVGQWVAPQQTKANPWKIVL